MFKIGETFPYKTKKEFYNKLFGINYYAFDKYKIKFLDFDDVGIMVLPCKDVILDGNKLISNKINNFNYLVVYSQNKKINFQYLGIFKRKDDVFIYHDESKFEHFLDIPPYSCNLTLFRFSVIPFAYPKVCDNGQYELSYQYDFYRECSSLGDKKYTIEKFDYNTSNYIFDMVKILILNKYNKKEIKDNEHLINYFKEIATLEQLLYKESYIGTFSKKELNDILELSTQITHFFMEELNKYE